MTATGTKELLKCSLEHTERAFKLKTLQGVTEKLFIAWHVKQTNKQTKNPKTMCVICFVVFCVAHVSHTARIYLRQQPIPEVQD